MHRRILAWLFLAILCLGCAPRGRTEETLATGDKSAEVLEMKKRLQELRYIEKGQLTRTFTEKTAASLREFQRLNGLPETGELDARTREALFSGSAIPRPHDTLPPLKISGRPELPELPELDAEGFPVGEDGFLFENDEDGLWIWLGRNLRIVITRLEDNTIPMVWFETEIRTRNGESFRTAMTDPEHPGKKFRYPHEISRESRFVLGFSDDFYATRMAKGETVGVIIRDGQLISRETNSRTGHHLPNLDMLALYPDGRMEVFDCNELSPEELLARGVKDVFSFGPWLLRNGEINELVYSYYRNIEPRHALGMIAPGHYLLLSVQGRTKASAGASLQRVAEILRDHGVTEALNLDGGNTMALIFRGRMLNKLAVYKNREFVRTVTSLIGIGSTEDQAD